MGHAEVREEWIFDIHHGAASASHAAIILAAFALTIIILLIGAADLRRDKTSSFVIRPFLVAFTGNLIGSFQFMIVESHQLLDEQAFAMIVPAEFLTFAKEKLEPQAEPQKRCTGFHRLRYGTVQSGAPQILHRITESTNSR